MHNTHDTTIRDNSSSVSSQQNHNIYLNDLSRKNFNKNWLYTAQ